jgi:hypothetical protein
MDHYSPPVNQELNVNFILPSLGWCYVKKKEVRIFKNLFTLKFSGFYARGHVSLSTIFVFGTAAMLVSYSSMVECLKL